VGIIENIKEAVSLIQKTDNIDLTRGLLNVQAEALDLLEQNGKPRQRVSELEDQITKKGEVKLDGSFYYRHREDGSLDGPYCTRCWDVQNLLVTVHLTRGENPRMRVNKCPECKGLRAHLMVTYWLLLF
jgi:hypothetical protein